jgi:hypothetical protein
MTRITQLPVASTITDTGVFVIFDNGRTQQLQWQTFTQNNLRGLTGAKGDTGTQGIQGPVGPVGPQGSASTVPGPQGPKGDTGTAATVQVGTVSVGPQVTVTSTGTNQNVYLNFVIPQGPKGDTGTQGIIGPQGDTGTAATIQIGEVSTGASVSVTTTGTSQNAYLNFVIPYGPQGPQGAKGDTGTTILSTATASVLGGVKIGSGISIAGDGTVSLPPATGATIGGVKIGAGLTVSGDGTIATTSSINLSTATASVLGGVKIGSGISINGNAIISVSTASSSTVGGVKIGAGINITADGTISATTATPYTLTTATTATLGGIKLGSGLLATADGTVSVNTAGIYVAISTATASTVGGIKVGSGVQISADGTLSVTTGSFNGGVITGQLVLNNTLNSTSTQTGAFVVNGGVGIAKDIVIGGTATLQQTAKVVTTSSGVSGTVSFDCSKSTVFYTTATNNFVANFTNVSITNNRSIPVTVVIAQGITPYSISALQIAGTAQSINWLNTSTPTTTANKIEFYNFELMRINGAWVVTGSLASYG